MAYVEKIQKGAGKHADSVIEIHYNKKAKPLGSLGGGNAIQKHLMQMGGQPQEEEEVTEGPWCIMVMDEDVIPGGAICAECEKTHFNFNDFLCPECREAS